MISVAHILLVELRSGTMSDVFERYERHYCDLSANLSNKCTTTTIVDGDTQQRKQRTAETEVALNEADDLMDLEARSLQPSVKAMLIAKERINQSSDRIKSSRRTVLETEELGITILQDLHQQRQSLLHASNNLHAVDETITNSKKVLVAMTRRMSRNKWIMGSIVGVLVLAILLILHLKIPH
ncbi:hypothetical protein RchiOBHm_Chr7g0182011 [Rosa chinensis]|uniref:Uncharacterized protein n=1 Tax=Rosa chinensis TaxID=74649 RepID=A0A2P6P2V6_ROSCH|nr:hypothetical protein RchiOBHm_Chr7g0182011 [Rosa chinensis]